jgi:hypothetical protein
MGKSSLVKAVHAEVRAQGLACTLVEIQREDLPSVGRLLGHLRRAAAHRFVLFCDDLSFSHDDQHYKSLKAVLDGGIEGRPANVILYATSNRRHLMPRDMIENERSTAISPSEAVEEKVSLSDRFGLWLGFHPCTQDEQRAPADVAPAEPLRASRPHRPSHRPVARLGQVSPRAVTFSTRPPAATTCPSPRGAGMEHHPWKLSSGSASSPPISLPLA